MLAGLAAAGSTAVALWPRRHPWRMAALLDGVGDALARPGGAVDASRARRRRTPAGERMQEAAPRERHPTRRRESDTAMVVCVCAELLAVALSSGCGPHDAVIRVAESRGPGRALAPVADAVRRGSGLVDAVDLMPHLLGERWRAVGTVLALAVSSGVPAAEPLRRVAAAERLRDRRTREQRVRRLPVLLLLPLTTMVLPAFVLVTLVPLALSASQSLGLP